MTQFLLRRWPIAVAFYLLLCGADLPLAGAPVPPDKDEITNSIGMKLKLIPAGKFLMGSPKEEKYGAADGPQHPVEITRPFYMGVYPVTKGQFAAFVKDAGYQTEAEQGDGGETWRNPVFLLAQQYEPTDDDPVVMVSWNDAVKFCEWLSKKEKKTYTLPTEAEWEYACRAGTTTAYSFGDERKDFGDYAWDDDNSEGHTHPVGGKKPNPWGLYDMHGNVEQWCSDWFGRYPEKEVKDPQGPDLKPKNPSPFFCRVLRGGSWFHGAWDGRSANRRFYNPVVRLDQVGFRVVRRPE